MRERRVEVFVARSLFALGAFHTVRTLGWIWVVVQGSFDLPGAPALAMIGLRVLVLGVFPLTAAVGSLGTRRWGTPLLVHALAMGLAWWALGLWVNSTRAGSVVDYDGLVVGNAEVVMGALYGILLAGLLLSRRSSGDSDAEAEENDGGSPL